MKYRHLVSALLGIALTLTPRAFCQSVPTGVSYQGRLSDLAGHPLPAGSYLLYLRIWNSATNTSSGLIWSQQQTVPVNANRVFNVILGASGGLPIPGDQPLTNDVSSAFGEPNRYVGVAVASSNGIAIPNPSEIVPRQQILASPYAVLAQTAVNVINGIPPGTILSFAGDTPPLGFLLCDGTAYASSTYPQLAGALRGIWNSSANPDSFNVPDLRSRFLLGSGQGGGLSNRLIGQHGGEEAHLLSVEEMPKHSHGYTWAKWDGGSRYDGSSSPVITPNYVNGTTDVAGGDKPHSIMPPYSVVTYIIKY